MCMFVMPIQGDGNRRSSGVSNTRIKEDEMSPDLLHYVRSQLSLNLEVSPQQTNFSLTWIT